MLIGTGCGVPGVMASRTIEQERDRQHDDHDHHLHPLRRKDADRWPDGRRDLRRRVVGCASSAYFVGIAAIIISGIILKKTKPFAGEPAPVRHGAAGLPCSDREERTARHLGARLELH